MPITGGETKSQSDCELGYHQLRHIPWLTSSSFEIMCRRTSGNSSFSIWRNMGSK